MSAPVAEQARAGVCAPLGFRGGVAAAGIRGDGDETRTDLAVIRSDTPATAAGVFTRNTVKAAPVVISQLTLRRGTPISADRRQRRKRQRVHRCAGIPRCAGDVHDRRRCARSRPQRCARVQHRRHRPVDADGPYRARYPRRSALDVAGGRWRRRTRDHDHRHGRQGRRGDIHRSAGSPTRWAARRRARA